MSTDVEIPRRGRIMLRAKSNAPFFNDERQGTKTIKRKPKRYVAVKGEKIHVVHAGIREGHSKHFVGEVETYEGGIVRAVAMSSSSKTRRKRFSQKAGESGLGIISVNHAPSS